MARLYYTVLNTTCGWQSCFSFEELRTGTLVLSRETHFENRRVGSRLGSRELTQLRHQDILHSEWFTCPELQSDRAAKARAKTHEPRHGWSTFLEPRSHNGKGGDLKHRQADLPLLRHKRPGHRSRFGYIVTHNNRKETRLFPGRPKQKKPEPCLLHEQQRPHSLQEDHESGSVSAKSDPCMPPCHA